MKINTCMKIGFIISMYDETNVVKKTVNVLKQNKCPIIVIRSNPKESSKVLDQNLVDHYEKLPDLAEAQKRNICYL